ncbi:MDR family MFS transporter [Thermomonospora amylolytica]|uniref:MDR family MFS transporter n=1 Tax=Thermomonospora amylolytica TaxID=1411117 RepID=UPI000E6C4BA8
MVGLSTTDDRTGPAPAQWRPYTHRQVLQVLGGLVTATLTAMISTSIVSTALPTIMGDLGGQEQLAWVASAPLLAMTATAPLWGKVSDLFGRKRMFQTALVIYALASVVAGLSQNVGMLIAARALQGLGAGGVMSLTQVVLGDIVEPRERGRYAGYLGAAFGVATVTGPLVGGLLVDAPGLGWRSCFLVPVPLAVGSFIVIQKVLRLPPADRTRRPRIDWLGAVAIAGGASTVMVVLSLGGRSFPWNSGWTYGLTALSLALLAAAVVAERRAPEPILPPRLFRDRTFVLTAAVSLLIGMVMFGVMIFLPQYLQVVRGMSPTASGLMTLPLVGGMLAASTVSGQLTTRTGRYKIFPVSGLVLLTCGVLLLSGLHTDSPLAVIGADCAIAGIGLGLTMQTLILAAQNAVPRADLAAATTGVTFFRSLGSAVGVAAFGAILTARLTSGLADRLRAAHLPVPADAGTGLGTPAEIRALPEPYLGFLLDSYTEGLRTVYLVGVPLAALALLAVLALRELPLRTSAPAEPPAVEPVEPTTPAR